MSTPRLAATTLTVALIAMLLSTATAAAAEPPPSGAAAIPAGQVAPEASPQALAWYDGAWQYSQITNCWSIIQGMPYSEYGVATYAGFRADPDAAQPAPNQTYYVHVVIGGLGNSCSGQRAYIDVALPANTSLAIDGTNPVRCYYDGVPLPANECPQSLPASTWNPGAYQILSVDTANARTWPIPQGRILEIQVPVRSTTLLTNSPFQANVWMLDGNSSPWLRPQQGVYVFSSSPSILYPSPSTITVTATTARSQAYLYTFGIGGTGYFDLGYNTSYGLEHEAVAIPAGGNAFFAWDDWTPASLGGTLQPDTLYHWRFVYAPSSGPTVYGADQSFRTLPDGRATVGNGAAGTCTGAAFHSAFAGAKEITFNCGTLPVTITLSSSYFVPGNLTISGGNKVTLAGSGTSGMFSVQNGGHLTLNQVTLADGVNNAACGGAVHVYGGGTLSASRVRLYNNRSAISGGALCVDATGYAEIYDSQFSINSTPAGPGGAIYNAGTLDMFRSDVSANTALSNGGGVNNSGTFFAIHSLFAGNSANNGSTSSGGGIYDSGNSSLSTSTVSGNFANYGGGLTSAGSSMYLTGLTIAFNAGDPGPGAGISRFFAAGGLDTTNPAGTTVLRNVLLAGNWPGNCTTLAFNRFYTSGGTNLDDANRCAFAGVGDKVNANARLGALANNGGNTRTHALGGGSAAIDAGNNLYCGFYDQRGFMGPSGLRQVDGDGGGAVCDIGAFEYWPTVFLPFVRR